jgi:hypothetical protein
MEDFPTTSTTGAVLVAWGVYPHSTRSRQDLSGEVRAATGAGSAPELSSVAEAEATSNAVEEAPNSVLSASALPRTSSAGCRTGPEDRLRSAVGSSFAAVSDYHLAAVVAVSEHRLAAVS